MELRELRSFCTAARIHSISKAAQELGLGQPTVTTHIKKLEEELGMVLFDRVKRPIQLTLAGDRLAAIATPLVEGIDSLAAMTTVAEERGPVRIASTPDIIPHTLIRVVRVFLARFPQVHLKIRSGTREEVLHMVQDGEVDLGVVQHPEKSEGLDFQGLFLYERVLITPLDHPLLSEPLSSIDQIARYPLILMGRGTYTRAILEEEFRRKGLEYDIIVELDSMDMIKRYVGLGMGISVGPRLAIEPEDRKTVGVISLANLLPVEQAGIVTLRGKTISSPTQNFMSVMRDVLAPAGPKRG
ncbi:MAG: LysR family transcriptional regulator [Chloroflexi bacterium]|nr:LysR family transcriptional regulator [Chloroflexota bacterium]MDA1228517.1 LysR family transcriptional regulator [Chloroflexota bacterium]